MTVRATALGYQGFGNVGDEAILIGIEELLRDTPLSVEALICGPEPIAAFPAARRIRTRRLRPNLRAIRSLQRSRVLLLTGGGLLHDHWWTVLPLYLAWVLLARMVGAQVVWVGVGIGPLRSRRSRLLASWALRLSHLVMVRDPESAALVGDIASGLPVYVIPDPAVFAPPPPAAQRSGTGLIVRAPTPLDTARTGTLVEALAEAAARLGRRGSPVTVLTFGGPADRSVAESVAGAVRRLGGETLLEELPPDPVAVMHRLAALEQIITVRLHGLILAALVGTPAAAIAYDPKVSAWASRLGVAEAAVGLEDVDAERILAALGRCRSADALDLVQARLETLRAEAPDIRQLLTAVL